MERSTENEFISNVTVPFSAAGKDQESQIHSDNALSCPVNFVLSDYHTHCKRGIIHTLFIFIVSTVDFVVLSIV